MNRVDLEKRVKKFRMDVLRLCKQLPREAAGFETARQVIRSAGSVGANYRASKRAKSGPDFICKIEIVLEEADETHYWLEVICDSEMIRSSELDMLICEANQLTAIFAATDKTAKRNRAGFK